jgi:ribosomal protein S18 acetylase RimI-like enzyme
MGSDIESTPATPDERSNLLALMREHMADRLERTLQLMGLTLEQFAELYRTRGEVRTIRHRGAVAGYCWIEKRDRDLHLHAIFVLPEHRGLGIGSAVMQDLEREFGAQVDRIELGVHEANEGAKSLYLRQGFEVEKTLPELGFVIMGKWLQGEPSH